jgi:hypothetical protein
VKTLDDPRSIPSKKRPFFLLAGKLNITTNSLK